VVYQGNPAGRICVGAKWRRLQNDFYRAVTVWACCRCGGPVDKRLRFTDPRNRWAPSIEHTIPKSVRPDLAMDPRYWKLAHFGCNSSRGNGVTRGRGVRTGTRATSRNW
jgi:hypothetical protein